jgi:hypothetical protein
MGLSPTFSNHTPPIAGLQTGKAELGRRRDQVVPDAPLMLQEFRGHHRAHQMSSLIRTRTAATIAIEARDRVCAAGLQFGTKDIGLVVHTPSVTGTCTLVSPPSSVVAIDSVHASVRLR